MGYLDTEGLKKYTWNVRNRVTKNNQLTKVEKVALFCPASETELEPIVNFKFTEILPAEGTKGPDNPSIFSGVSEVKVTRCGKNLLQTSNIVQTPNIGLTVSVNIDGSISVSGTTPSNSGCYLYFFNSEQNTSIGLPNFFLPGKTYVSTFSCNDENVDFNIIFYNGISWTPAYSNSATFIVPNDAISCLIRMRFLQDKTYDCTAKIQIELASTATTFEPYSGNEYTIQLGDTYYGGSVNFATGIMTVDWHAVQVSDMSNIAYDSTNNRWNMRSSPRADYTVHPVCSHAEYDITSVFTNATDGFFRWRAMGFYTEWWFKSPATTLEDFLSEYGDAYVVYKLYEPITIQLTPTQIKSLSSPDKYNPTINTVYTDQESVQVGWIREDVVHKSDEETIDGLKTFTGTIRSEQHVVGTIIRNNDFTRGTNPSSDAYWSIPLCDGSSPEWDVDHSKNHGRAGLLECRVASNGNITTSIRAYKNDLDSANKSIIAASYDLVNDIAYATAPETSDERSGSTDIVTRKWAAEKMWNWQKTLKKSFVQLKAIPESALDTVVEFTFTETPPVEGAKGQSNPSVIDGISQVSITRCGKNLLPKTHIGSTMESRGITATYNNDGSIHLSGTANSSYLPYLRFFTIEPGTVPSVFAANTTLTFSIKCSDSNVYGVLYDSDSPIAWGSGIAIRTTNTPVTYTMSSNIQTANFSLVVARGAVVDCDVYLQIEYGDKATEWEAPADTEYAISLNDTYYGGLIDLNSGLMTVTWEGIVLTGNETFNKYIANDTNNVYYTLATSYPAVSTTSCHCTHYPSGGAPGNCYVKTDEGKVVFIDNNIGSIENFKSWVANEYSNGTPVTVVYNISEPYTIQLTPTQISSLPSLDKYTPRINTFYTDVASVQVGYQRYTDEHKNADSASKLQTSVSLTTNLASTTAIAFDGSTDQNSIPVSGVLPISNGGTGSSTQNFVDLSNSQVINGVKTFGSTIEGVVDRSIKDGSGNVIANTYATKATATSLADGLMSSTDKSKLDSIGTVFNFKGSVADTASLPGSGNTAGDAYLVQSPLGLQAWNGTSWVDIGSSALLPISDNEIDTVFA